MDIEIFKRDLQRIHLSDEARQRLVRTVNKTQANESRILPTKRHFFRPALLTGVLLFLLVGTVLFLLLPDLLDRSGLSGCPPEFADRYYSLIEIDSTAYIFQGNGTLYQMESDNSLQKIGRLRTDKILSDGDKIFYTRGNKVYQSGTDLSDRSLVFQEQQPIELDYITDNVILYHFGNHDHYTLFDRLTGEKSRLFSESAKSSYFFRAGSDNRAVFTYTGQDYSESLLVVNLADKAKHEIFAGTIPGRVVVLQNSVYFTLEGEPEDPTYSYRRELWSVDLDGNNLIQHDLSAISFTSIQAIAGSGQDLLIATNENVQQHQGKIYLYRPGTNSFLLLQDNIGLIDRLFATEQYYSYYDMGTGDTAGQAFAGRISSQHR